MNDQKYQAWKAEIDMLTSVEHLEDLVDIFYSKWSSHVGHVGTDWKQADMYSQLSEYAEDRAAELLRRAGGRR